MKKIMLISAAALLIGVGAASAQAPRTDTTKNRSKSTEQNPERSSDRMKKDKRDGDRMKKDKTDGDRMHGNKNTDRTLIHTADVPVSLRESLRGSDYTGWENGRVYKTKSGEYLVEIRNNGTTKTHRFDANGKPMKE